MFAGGQFRHDAAVSACSLICEETALDKTGRRARRRRCFIAEVSRPELSCVLEFKL